MAERSKTLNFGSELEVQILSVTEALFIRKLSGDRSVTNVLAHRPRTSPSWRISQIINREIFVVPARREAADKEQCSRRINSDVGD
ncbi:hypothetical protein J6590_037561 [Homalodisca vitripennis]|nr:hypothetical protein J6590_037561 [Homalodisca vitripennis]